MSADPMREPGMNWQRAAVAYWWAMLALSVAVSSYGNIRHAEGVVPAEYLVEGRWIAGSLPVVLLLMIEGIAIGARAGLAGWQRRMATLFVGALACVVLASSYVGLLSLVEATRLFQVRALSLGLAGVPDLLMIAATVYVMSLRAPVGVSVTTESVVVAEERATDAVDSAVAPTLSNVVSAESESMVSTVPQVDSAPEYSGVHVLESTVVMGGESTGNPAPVSTVDSAGDLQNPLDAGCGLRGESTVDAVDTDVSESTDPVPAESTGFEPVDVSGFAGGESAEYIVDSCGDDVDSAEVESTESTSPVSTESNRDSSLGERVVAVLGTDADPATVAEALRLRAEDLSLRRIAEQLGVGSHSTIRKWIQTAEEQAKLAPAGG